MRESRRAPRMLTRRISHPRVIPYPRQEGEGERLRREAVRYWSERASNNSDNTACCHVGRHTKFNQEYSSRLELSHLLVISSSWYSIYAVEDWRRFLSWSGEGTLPWAIFRYRIFSNYSSQKFEKRMWIGIPILLPHRFQKVIFLREYVAWFWLRHRESFVDTSNFYNVMSR